jgi:hypothetical protein
MGIELVYRTREELSVLDSLCIFFFFKYMLSSQGGGDFGTAEVLMRGSRLN